ncbi:MAG: ester cyclase [Deltaproteobacteria bacterium]|nr:ester cyclase [Deltaproteobacteria bacterium]
MKNMDSFALEDFARDWLIRIWQNRDIEFIYKYHSPEFIDHDSADRPSDNSGFISGVESLFKSFPDFKAIPEDIIADQKNGKIAIRWTAKGTQKGDFLGIPPTNKVIQFKGIEILKIQENLVTERWGEWDAFEILIQISDQISKNK